MTARRQQALAFLDALAAVDVTGMRALFTDDAVLHVERSTQRWAGMPAVVTGGDAVTTLFTAHHGANGERPVWAPNTTTFRHEMVVAEGEHVVIQTERHSVTADGRDYDNTYVWTFRFAGDLIAEMWEHLDTAHAFTVVTRPEGTSAAWRGVDTPST